MPIAGMTVRTTVALGHTQTLQKLPKQANSLSIWRGRLLEPGVLLEARRRETAHQENHIKKIAASAAHRDS